MKKNNQLVKQCSCCDKKFSQISIPLISVSNRSKLANLMKKEIDRMKFKGSLSFASANGLIASFYYEYANKLEESKSIDLCKNLYEIANDFFGREEEAKVIWEYLDAA